MKKLSELFLLLSVLFIQNAYCQTTVYVEANEKGRGILKTRGSECFVITPHHLLEGYNGPITVFGEGNERSRANLLKSYTGDLAILRFEGENNQNCTKWQLAKNYSSIVGNIAEGYLERRNKDGSVSPFAVTISDRDGEYITIQPKNDSENRFAQGMSGSSLFVEYQGEKVFLGMFQSISDDETGSVIRADLMDKLLSIFFNPIVNKNKSKVITDKDLTKEVLDFRFELLDIEKSGSRVTFHFDVTSLKKDKVLILSHNDMFLYDDKGTETKADKVIIGNKTTRDHYTGFLNYNLIQETSVPMKITFTDISSSAQFATLLKVGFSDEESTGNFEFRELYFGDESEDFSEVIEEKGNWSKESLGFKYELLGFEKTGTDVVFTFTITSLDRDKTIGLSHIDVVLYDDKGLETMADIIFIGNKTTRDHYTEFVNYNLVEGIQVPLIISFKNIASSATGVALLKIGFSNEQNKSTIQIRKLTFPIVKTNNNSKAISNNDNNSTTNNVGAKSTSCSEIYFYRKKAFLECEETVYLYNHGELLVKLEAGTRYKSLVCDDRSFKFSAKTNPDVISYSTSKPDIEMGKKYYMKISCAVGVATVALQEIEKGEKDLSNNGKFKRKLVILPLPEY